MSGRLYQASKSAPEDRKLQVLKEIRLGYLNLSEGMFEQARLNFLLALQYDSKCADAYWGLMLYKLKIKNEEELLQDPPKYKDVMKMQECQNAFTFGDDTQKKIYEGFLEEINKIVISIDF